MGISGEAVTAARTRARRHPVLNFVLLAWGLSWSAWIGLSALGFPLLARTLIAMFGPLIASRILSGGDEVPVRESVMAVAIKIRRSAAAVVVVGLLMGAGILLSIFGGVQHAQSDTPAVVVMLRENWGILLGIAVLSCMSAYGEEAGWRGYLLAHLQHLGRVRAALVTAPIWAIWHYPAILLFGFDYPHHRLIGAGVLLVVAIPLTLIQTWVRVWAGTVFASTATHAAFNIVGTVCLLLTTHVAMYLAAPVGLLGMVPLALFATWIVATRQLDPVAAPQRVRVVSRQVSGAVAA